MKAIVHEEYGSPHVLESRDIDKPVVNDDDALVRVHAAAVNPGDWHLMRGTPRMMRIVGSGFGFGVRKPKTWVAGQDVAGRVEAVGKNVTQLQAGDEVYGETKGAFAEYLCASEGALAPKPANVTFEQAAAVPIAASTALQGLRDKGKVQPGQKVLINGASGGVGTFAVQIAKSLGANVTGVCSSRNGDLVRSIGADHVIDYTQEDFTKIGQRYDLIFDLVGNHSLSACRRALTRRGILILSNGEGSRWLGPIGRIIRALVISPFVSQKLRALAATPRKENLLVLKALIEAGEVTPVIDRTYQLVEVPEAMRYLEEGHARGKVVIIV